MALDYNFITGLQRDLADVLAADETMQHVHVIREAARERSGGVTFEEAVNKALLGKVPVNGKLGLALLIFCPEGKPATRSNTGIVSDFEVVIRVVENTSLNASTDHGTGTSCEDALVEAMLIVQNWTPLRGHTLSVGEFYKVPLDNQPQLWAWEFIVNAHDAQTARPKCGLPRITGAEHGGGKTITITAPTAEARTFYTLDGSLPTPNAGILYEVPFDLTSSATIRAMSWLTGCLPSDCASLAA